MSYFSQYPELASAWASYSLEELKDFFSSSFFEAYCAEKKFTEPYEMRLEISKDMERLGLIPLTALEDGFSEERELEELKKFAELYEKKS